MTASSPTVAVVLTVKNDPTGCAETVRSLLAQTRRPDQIMLVDGGSDHEAVAAARKLAQLDARIRLIEAEGANIARGRNIGTQAASAHIIATTDSGCRAESDWLEKLVKPFEDDPQMEFVGGFYRIAPQTLLEGVVGLCTMRGQLDPVRPETFNPSGRSMAYTKELWMRTGGWPEWIGYSEDTLFSGKLRSFCVRSAFAAPNWGFAGGAVVHWRPRTSLGAIARQFFNYGTGRGHTQIGAPDFAYNLRNLLLMCVALPLCWVTPWGIAMFTAMFGYFYVWTFHGKATRVRRRIERVAAYPLTLIVMWVILVSHTAGYVVGTIQRWKDRERYEHRMQTYMATGT